MVLLHVGNRAVFADSDHVAQVLLVQDHFALTGALLSHAIPRTFAAAPLQALHAQLRCILSAVVRAPADLAPLFTPTADASAGVSAAHVLVAWLQGLCAVTNARLAEMLACQAAAAPGQASSPSPPPPSPSASSAVLSWSNPIFRLSPLISSLASELLAVLVMDVVRADAKALLLTALGAFARAALIVAEHTKSSRNPGAGDASPSTSTSTDKSTSKNSSASVCETPGMGSGADCERDQDSDELDDEDSMNAVLADLPLDDLDKLQDVLNHPTTTNNNNSGSGDAGAAAPRCISEQSVSLTPELVACKAEASLAVVHVAAICTAALKLKLPPTATATTAATTKAAAAVRTAAPMGASVKPQFTTANAPPPPPNSSLSPSACEKGWGIVLS